MSKSKDNKNEKSKNGKKNTSLRLEAKTLKALKIRAAEEDTSVQSIIERLIELYLSNQVKLPKKK